MDNCRSFFSEHQDIFSKQHRIITYQTIFDFKNTQNNGI